MSLVSVEHLLRSAVLHHQAGRLGEAEEFAEASDVALAAGEDQEDLDAGFVGKKTEQAHEGFEVAGLFHRFAGCFHL